MEEAARKRRERLEKLKASQSLIVNDHPVSATPVGNAAVSEDDNSNKHKQSVVDSAPLVGTNKKRSRDEDGDLKNAEADAAAQLEAAKQQQKAETIERIAETLNKEVKEQLEELSQAEVVHTFNPRYQ
jgi:hypothetical protein